MDGQTSILDFFGLSGLPDHTTKGVYHWLENQMVCTIINFFIGKFSKSWAVVWAHAIFPLFLVCSADLDIFSSGLFSHNVKFYRIMFMHKKW